MTVKKISLSRLNTFLKLQCDNLRAAGLDASEYKDYIIAMLFLKRVNDQFEIGRIQRASNLLKEFPDLSQEEIEDELEEVKAPEYEFFVPRLARWKFDYQPTPEEKQIELRQKEIQDELYSDKLSKEEKLALSVELGGLPKSSACLDRGVCGIKALSIVGNYLYHLLISAEDSWKQFEQGSTFTAVGSKEIFNFQLSVLNSDKAQKKIAYILTTCDTVIEQTQSAIAKYKAIKQGLLHDLFTRGLDANGKLRPSHQDAPELYKESELGMIPKEWKVKSLDKLVENFDGRRIPVKQGDRDNQAKVYPYYGASGIIDYVNNYIFDDELILLGEDGENVLSRNLPLAFHVSGKIWVNNHAHVLKPKSFMDIGYLTAALELIDYTPIVSGSPQPKITQKELNKLLVTEPNKEEQKKIAKRLYLIDNKLKSEETLLQKYQIDKARVDG